METVSVETGVSNPNECQLNLELSDKQKKRSGKNKKKSRKKEGETEKTTSEDQVPLPENCLSTLPVESCQRTSVSPEEPGVTLLHIDPVLSTKEDSLPDANTDGSNRKRSRRNKKKKKAPLHEEKMLDDAVKTANEDQVHPPKNPLSNLTIQEDSCRQAQDSCEKPEAAQLFMDPIISTREDSQSDAINMTSSLRKRKRKDRKKDKDRHAVRESGVDTNSEVTTKSNARHDSEAEASKLISVEVEKVASVVINGCLKSEDDTVEQQKDTEVKAYETVSQTPKAKKKKRKTKTVEVCNPLGNALATSTVSGSVECMESTVEQGKGAEVKADDTVSQTQSPKAKKKMRRKTKTVEVCNPSGNGLSTSTVSGPVECMENTVEQGKGAEVKADDTVSQTQSPEAKKKKRRKTKTVEVCNPSGNGLSTSTVSGSVECMENTVEQGKGAEVKADDTVSQTQSPEAKKKKRRKTKTVEVCNPSGNGLSTSTVSGSVECMENTVEQRKGAEVETDDTVSQTQSPKAKKKKKRRKTKTVEVCNPLGDTLATSTKSGSVECMENNDGNASQELMSSFESKRENSATGRESGVQNLGKGKEKKADENTEVNEDVLGAGVCEARSKKRKGKKRKASSADHETTNMEVCDPSGNTLPATIESGSVECLLDHANREVLENFDGNAGQVSVVEDTASKTEKSATSEKSGNAVSNQDALGTEGVDEVGCERKKRKRNKMKTCESVAMMDSDSVQCLLSHSNIDGVENCDGIADGETAGKDLASKIEDSATEGKYVQNVGNTENMEEDKKGEVDENALGAGVDKVEVETKKRKSKKKKKSCEDQKSDKMDEKNDVSIPRKEEEPEIGGEKAETSLSSCVFIQSNVVTSPETGDLPRCSCEGQNTKKLVVLDLNGILADIVQGYTGQFVPDGKVSYRSVFKRPFVDSFIEFCFERYDVGIWSSRRIGLDYMTSIVMGKHARNLLFCFDQNICTTTSFNSQEKSSKPLFLKDLRRVWNRFGTCLTCGKRKYDERNTLLVDDSPQKALCNPPHTGIFPSPYQYRDSTDSALGPDGELRKYLERLADAENVQKFVEENPIGQAAITETHESWEFYSKVVEAHK